jgi:hypothetical protein
MNNSMILFRNIWESEQIMNKISLMIIILFLLSLSGCLQNTKNINNITHKNITVTIFWIGEQSSPENDYIPNDKSVWDTKWEEHYGGFDDPSNRSGFYPKGFIPHENSFYFALPYNDYNEEGNLKQNNNLEIKKVCKNGCKNKWIKITKGNKISYAQWEDSGPFEYDDFPYVFENKQPINKKNNNAGLDVSPAVRDYLNLEDIDIVDWQFVDFKDVPNGEWKKTITNSSIYWE